MAMSKERFATLTKRPTNMGHKVPYVDIISEAILTSPNRRLTAKEIFDHVSAKFGPMKSADTLKNTIRHTLSRYKIFRKVQRGKQKKPNWWSIVEESAISDDQVEDLQQDIKQIVPPPRVMPRSHQECGPAVQQHQRCLSLESGDNSRYISPRYPYQPSGQQPVPQLYCTGESAQEHGHGDPVDVRTVRDIGWEEDLYHTEYGPLLMNDSLVAGTSHNAYAYGLPPIGETIPHLFPAPYPIGQTFPETTFTPALTTTGLLIGPPSSSTPEYYQM